MLYTQGKQGFTLIELLITLAVTSILYSIAVPSLHNTLENQQRERAYKELEALIHYTRSRAAFSSSDVIMCPTENQQHCVNDWQRPIMVFIDKNKNRQRDEEEPIDRITVIGQDSYNLSWRASGTSRYLRYIQDGSTGYQNGTFTFCPNPTPVAPDGIKKLVVYFSGRVREAIKSEITLSNC